MISKIILNTQKYIYFARCVV